MTPGLQEICLHEKINGHTHTHRHVDGDNRIVYCTATLTVRCTQCGLSFQSKDISELGDRTVLTLVPSTFGSRQPNPNLGTTPER